MCLTEAIAVTGAGEMDIRCGGAPMIEAGSVSPNGEPAADAAGGTLMGKRYTNEGDSLELLVIKAGDGSLGLGDELLELKDSKPLPSSD
ncbi:MAG: hypothetical protein KUG57_09170 [Ilumatobacteraceae bacterium]|nr:hypothetical protein [Ilumatobacteraceae bacterium]